MEVVVGVVTTAEEGDEVDDEDDDDDDEDDDADEDELVDVPLVTFEPFEFECRRKNNLHASHVSAP